MTPPTGLPADPLAGLRPWQWPEPLPWWPPAPGWWLLTSLLLAALALALLVRRRRRREHAPANLARRELAALTTAWQRDGDTAAYVGALSLLLRRFVQTRFPGQTAGLCGARWLDFLAAHDPGDGFRTGVGRRLLDAPWQRAPADLDAAALARLVERWIRHNGPTPRRQRTRRRRGPAQ